MQVAKLNNSCSSYNEVSQKKIDNVSFQREVDKVISSKELIKGKIVTFLEETNAFKGFTKEEELKFKTILKDDKVTQKEFESIPYEMLDKFKTLVLPTNSEHFNNFPYVDMSNKSKIMLSSVDLSGDSTFNQSVYKTYGNMSEDDIVNMSLELSVNIKQAYNEDNLEVYYIKGILSEINNFSPTEMKKMTLDVQNFLLEMINMSNDYMRIVNDPQVLKQLNNTKNFYSSLMNNYNDLKREQGDV